MKTFTKLLILSFCWLGWATALHAQTKVNLGKTTDLVAAYKAKAGANETNAATTGNKIRQTVPGRAALILSINVSKKEGTTQEFIGSVDSYENSTFFLRAEGNNLSGFIILKEQKKAYQYSSDAKGQAYLQEVDINKVICVEFKGSSVIKGRTSNQGATTAAAAVPLLESYPGAEAVVLLDFDGQYVSGTPWNGGRPIDAAPSTLTTAQMEEVWKLMSEDFRPYMLNITTNEAVFNSKPKNRRMRVIFTPTNTAAPGTGGVAYLGSFNYNDDTPCWVFINNHGKYAGEAGSHEVGHTLKLKHDGRISPAEPYFSGQASWAPIMGVGYYSPQVQWSKGEYPSANNTEDDLAIMATNGFGYRADEATRELVKDASGNIIASSNYGVIATRTDDDIFSFTIAIAPSTVNLNVKPSAIHPDLDVKLTLRNSASTIVASADPAGMSASITTDLGAGTYYLHIDGATGAMGANSDYASLGEYFVSGTIRATYCKPVITYGCGDGDFINNFSFNSLVNNNSGCNGQANGYINYATTGTLTTQVSRGQAYQLKMQSGPYPQAFGVWIDYNNNQSFNDAGEFVYRTTTVSTSAYTSTITIPSGATLGNKRMRVRSSYGTLFTSTMSCATVDYGETEDYTISIVAPTTSTALYDPNKSARFGNQIDLAEESTGMTIYPNPFQSKTNVTFSVEEDEDYTLAVYDVKGTLVKHMQTGKAKAGELIQATWEPEESAKGVYIIRLITQNKIQHTRVIHK